MKKYITRLLASLVLVASVFATPLLAPEMVAAGGTKAKACEGVVAIGGGDEAGECTGGGLEKFLKDIVNILLFVIGTISVIMIIVGGIRYVVSGGDSNAVTGAKNTILYSVIGLVVAIMAYAIINFVIASL